MDWQKLFEDHNIDFVTRGPNTKRGEISIRCPWCGEDDPSHHLGISLVSENWGCHRNGQHRGKSTPRLINALLGCSFDHAKLVARQYSMPDPSTLDEALAMLELTSEAPEPDKELSELVMPPEFEEITGHGFTRPFADYLVSRGYPNPYSVVRRFGLKCALTGKWKQRIIIPLFQRGVLIGWTSRLLPHSSSAPRYLSSSDAVKATIFNEDEVWKGGDLLYVTEGPFDAIKLDHMSRDSFSSNHHDYSGRVIRATCCFGTSWSVSQVCILNAAAKGFKKVCIVPDRDAVAQAMQTQQWLRHPDVVVGALPLGVKDPGDLTRRQVETLTVGLLRSFT